MSKFNSWKIELPNELPPEGHRPGEPATPAAEEAHPLSDLPDDELAKLAQKATDELAELAQIASRCEGEAAAVAEAFKSKPSPKTFGEKAVAEQLASNAREAFQARELATAPLLAERNKRLKARRLQELRARMGETPDAIEATAARLVQITQDFIEAVTSEMGVLDRTLARHAALVPEANNLERTVGDGQAHAHTRIKYDRAAEIVNERLQKRFGAVAIMGAPLRTTGVQLKSYVADGNRVPTTQATIRFPTPFSVEVM